VYKWKNRASLDEVLNMVTEMHRRMKGLMVNYEVTTIT
jgi:spore coat protein CotF